MKMNWRGDPKDCKCLLLGTQHWKWLPLLLFHVSLNHLALFRLVVLLQVHMRPLRIRIPFLLLSFSVRFWKLIHGYTCSSPFYACHWSLCTYSSRMYCDCFGIWQLLLYHSRIAFDFFLCCWPGIAWTNNKRLGTFHEHTLPRHDLWPPHLQGYLEPVYWQNLEQVLLQCTRVCCLFSTRMSIVFLSESLYVSCWFVSVALVLCITMYVWEYWSIRGYLLN